MDKQIKTQQTESMMSELARNTLTETKQRNQIEDKIDGDLKEVWQAAIAWSIIIIVEELRNYLSNKKAYLQWIFSIQRKTD